MPRFILFLITLLFALKINGQAATIFNDINKLKGLSSNRVTSIVKANNGFIWIGSENGLNRYDGKDIKVFNRQNSQIESNNISQVLIDSKERIWIATLGGGLNLYHSQTEDFTIYKNNPKVLSSIPSNQLNTLFEDSHGNLWVGSEDGISLFNDKQNTFTTYHAQTSNLSTFGNNSVTSIKEDSNGSIWFGTFGGGLHRLDMATKTAEIIESEISLFTNYIHDILLLDDNTLLIGTSGSGILKFDKKTKKFTRFFNEIPVLKRTKIVRFFHRDSKGSIWVGTDGNGLLKMSFHENTKQKNKKIYNNPKIESFLENNAIYEIMEDKDANIWVGTAWNGIKVLQQKNNVEFLFSDIGGNNPVPVLSIYKDDSHLFFGLDGKGLMLFDLNSKKNQLFNNSHNNSIKNKYIQNIIKASNGTYWLGTFANGLINFDLQSNNTTQYRHNPDDFKSISFNDIRYIVEDEFQNLWIASWGGGLNYFNTKTKKFESFRAHENKPKTLSSDNLLYIIQDNNWLWIATFGGGLERFNKKTKQIEHYNHKENNPNTISSDNVLSLLKDSRGYLWIGTSGGGVNRLDVKTNKINRFKNEAALRYQSITSIIEDNNGDIWFSTKEGITKFDYTNKQFVNFPFLDNEYHINSSFKDEKGLLYFGTTNGVLRFNPNNIVNKNVQPKVAITNFKLFNETVEVDEKNILKKNILNTDTIILEHDLNVLTFDFAALKFPLSDKCEYSIFMEGFDKNWRNIGFDRTITYTNLSPGNYTFNVKSREVGSTWGDKVTSIKINILKPFWLTWWAILVYIVLALFILYLFRKYTIAWEQLKANLHLERLNHERDIELYNLKQQFFTNISHDIRTPVTLILGSVNKLLNSEYVGNQQLNLVDSIRKNGNKLIHLVNELLDHRKLEFGSVKLHVTQENLIEFCQEIHLSFKEMAFENNVNFIFKTSHEDVKLWFDKIQLEKVLYNLLSNAFKYSRLSGNVEFLVVSLADTVEIQIKDTGVGIPKGQLAKIFNRFYQANDNEQQSKGGYGLGLAISKEIIELHHGKIIVDSIKGKGTVFIIKLKKGNTHFTGNQISKNNNITDYTLNPLLNFSEINKETTHPTTKANEHLSKQTILIVEDNLEIQEYISELLIGEFNVIVASDGKEALSTLVKTLPDIIISDVMMPVMDGISLAKSLKSNMRTSHIPIILLTARASFTHKIEGFEIGADDYITKPFNEELLKSRIRNVLKNRELLHEKFWKKELIPLSELRLNKADEEFMTKFIKILEDNINSANLKHVNFVCGELGMSHSVLYKKIKSLTNMSYVEFVRDFKLKTAKRLIEEQNFSVSDACYHVGYSDRKYFSKLFKKHFGQNPSNYLFKE